MQVHKQTCASQQAGFKWWSPSGPCWPGDWVPQGGNPPSEGPFCQAHRCACVERLWEEQDSKPQTFPVLVPLTPAPVPKKPLLMTPQPGAMLQPWAALPRPPLMPPARPTALWSLTSEKTVDLDPCGEITDSTSWRPATESMCRVLGLQLWPQRRVLPLDKSSEAWKKLNSLKYVFYIYIYGKVHKL